MPDFLVLYRADPTLPDPLTRSDPEHRAQGMAAWAEWGRRAGGALLDFGAPVQDVSCADGTDPAATVQSAIRGFSLLRADGVAHAEELLDAHPHRTDGGTIQLLALATAPAAPADHLADASPEVR